LRRRGASRLEIKELQGALEDFESASILLPDDKGVESDLSKVKARLKRQEADKQYKGGELELAEDLYGLALELDPKESKARANRTACLLKLFRYDEAIQEASLSLENLGQAEVKGRATALVRRGAAHAKLGKFKLGAADLEESLSLVDDDKVRVDLKHMQSQM